MSFDQLTPAWKAIPLDQVRERYDIGEASNDSVYLHAYGPTSRCCP